MNARVRIIEKDRESLEKICDELLREECFNSLSFRKDGLMSCSFLPCDLPKFRETMKGLEQYGNITIEEVSMKYKIVWSVCTYEEVEVEADSIDEAYLKWGDLNVDGDLEFIKCEDGSTIEF